MSTYQKAKRDLERWMKEDTNPDSFFTTMFDLYALPKDFPKFEGANIQSDPYQKVVTLENAFAEDLVQEFRINLESLPFIPYIQLYEFEALILSDPEKLKKKGLHIEGEDDMIDPDLAASDPLLEKDPLLDDEGMPFEEDEEGVDLEDDEFSDKEEW